MLVRSAMPLYSFVVPVFNVKAEYLKQCLDSILSDGSEKVEAILVDDCSTSGCELVCDEYRKRDERVKVFHLKENAGVSHARNFGVRHASGDWIVFVDSDDWIDEETCARLSNVMDAETDIVVFSASRESVGKSVPFGTTDKEIVYLRKKPSDEEGQSVEALSDHLLKQSLKTSPARYETIKYCWGKAFRKAFLLSKQIEFPDLSYCEDIVFMADAFEKAEKVVQIPDRLYHYRVSASNTVNSFRPHAVSEQRRFLSCLQERLGPDREELLGYAALLSMQICIARFLYNDKRKAALASRHKETVKCFSEQPYAEAFKHVDISAMKRKEKWKALLIRYRFYYLYYLGTKAKSIKTVRFS